MKTAEEYVGDIQFAFTLSQVRAAQAHNIALIKQIQLDAKRAGMTEAANIVDYWKSGHESRLSIWPDNECIKCEVKDCEELKQHILSARDNLKEI